MSNILPKSSHARKNPPPLAVTQVGLEEEEEDDSDETLMTLVTQMWVLAMLMAACYHEFDEVVMKMVKTLMKIVMLTTTSKTFGYYN